MQNNFHHVNRAPIQQIIDPNDLVLPGANITNSTLSGAINLTENIIPNTELPAVESTTVSVPEYLEFRLMTLRSVYDISILIISFEFSTSCQKYVEEISGYNATVKFNFTEMEGNMAASLRFFEAVEDFEFLNINSTLINKDNKNIRYGFDNREEM